jgi:hypothetical protein
MMRRIGYLAIEAQAFTVNEPSFFYSMYSPPRSEGQFRGAKDRLVEDMRFTSKMVRSLVVLAFIRELIVVDSIIRRLDNKDYKRLHHTQRIPIHPILYADGPPASGPTQTTQFNASTTARRKYRSLANKSRKRL